MRSIHSLSLIRIGLFAMLPFHMTDETAAASSDPNAGASSVDAGPESGSQSSADTASTSPGTTTDASQDAADTQSQTQAAEAGTVQTAESGAALNENTGNVEVTPDAHAEAKDRFAGVLATLSNIEHELAAAIRNELLALGTLLHLHSNASSAAATSGDYKAADLS